MMDNTLLVSLTSDFSLCSTLKKLVMEFLLLILTDLEVRCKVFGAYYYYESYIMLYILRRTLLPIHFLSVLNSLHSYLYFVLMSELLVHILLSV